MHRLLPLLPLLVLVAATRGEAAPQGRPSVGRLKLKDRSIELTIDAFGPGGVRRDAYAMPVLADIDLDLRSAPALDRGAPTYR